MSGFRSSRFRLNGFLLLLVCGLGALAWWFSGQQQTGPERLLAGDYEDINLITLVRHQDSIGTKTVRFEKHQSGWQMVAPEQHAVNTNQIRQLFTLLNEPVASVYDSAGRDLTQYGLQPARLTLRFNNQQFVLGAINTVSNKRYVLHDNKIKLVSEAVYGLATGKWQAFVSRK